MTSHVTTVFETIEQFYMTWYQIAGQTPSLSTFNVISAGRKLAVIVGLVKIICNGVATFFGG